MRRVFYLLLALTLLTACSPQVIVTSQVTAASTSTPTPQPTATATPIPLVEILPDLKIPANQIDGYYAKDASGKLLAVQDIYGNWLKAPASGTEIPKATTSEWQAYGDRMGNAFFINEDGTISGVEGLNINKENGIATIDIDGKGNIEQFSIRNMKVQDGNLMLAGYVWSPESKSWEVFNPGFPMETIDADRLGWFTKEDFANGNFYRFYERAFEELAKENGQSVEEYKKELFKGVIAFEEWGVHKRWLGGFGVIEGLNNNETTIGTLMFKSEALKEIYKAPGDQWKKTTREMLPFRSIPVFGLLKSGNSEKSDYVVFAQELLNRNFDENGTPDTRTVFSLTNKKIVWEDKENFNHVEWFKGAYGLATEKASILTPEELSKLSIILPTVSSEGGKAYPFVTSDAPLIINRNPKVTDEAGNLNPDISLYFFGANTTADKTYFLKLWVPPYNEKVISDGFE